MAKAKDLTGQRFGRLVVMDLDPEPYRLPCGKSERRWKCRCDCGKELSVLRSALTGKNGTRSCGCVRKEKTRNLSHDLTGRRFGQLTVMRPVDLEKPRPNGLRLGWLCQCDCGRTIVATQKDLELQGLQSCGCLLSKTASRKIVEKNVVGHYNGTAISAIQPDRPPNKNNTSGIKGVYWNSREQMWVARIGFKGKSIHLGRFAKIEDAEKARKEAEKKYFLPIIKEYEDLEKPSD